ncbi:MAG: pyruvate carboxylase subunit [Thermoplasmata archaeon]|jgi:biotin carboxyl carrier protein|nr:pyruvate carboxylase subunit [Thermoplasmata archaeon]
MAGASGGAATRATLEVDGASYEVAADRKAGTVTVDGETFKVALERNGAGFVAVVGGQRLHVALGDGTADIEGQRSAWRVTGIVAGPGAEGAATGLGARVKPPMNGKLERMLVKPGQAVAKGDVLFVLEAMKMQNEVRSPMAGVVSAVHGQVGAAVEPSQVLVEITPS